MKKAIARNFCGRDICRRGLSLLLALVLLVGLAPALGLESPVQAANSDTATVYFRNAEVWSGVFGYAWNDKGELLGTWPGKELTINTDGLYELTVPVGSSFIFNNNAGAQTGDLSVGSAGTYWINGSSGTPTLMSAPTVDGGKVTFTFRGIANNVYVAGSFNDWNSTAAKMTKSGGVFRYTCELLPGSYEYKFVVDGEWINDPGNPATVGNDNNNRLVIPGLKDVSFTAAKGGTTQLPPELTCVGKNGIEMLQLVSYTLKGAPEGVSLSGNDLTVSADCSRTGFTLDATAADGTTATVNVKLVDASTGARTIRLHFLDSFGWNGVAATVWTRSGSGDAALPGYGWPGQTVQRDDDGFYTLVVTYYPLAGQSLGYIFHNNNGTQTEDLIISAAALAKGDVELWIQPNSVNDQGKCSCTVSETVPANRSPEVNGSQVTFRYISSSAKKVYVAGSFNEWSTSAARMSQSGSVFTYTTNLGEGIHEYKFVVDGEWVLDPQNSAPGGFDGNSVVIIGGQEPIDIGEVTVKLHFYRANGSYTNWDAWMWSDTQDGTACKFASDTKGKVATITVDGRKNGYVNYIVRKTDWSDQEYYDRSIDITKVVSGTVHYYLNSGSESGILVYDTDVVFGGKATYAKYDYDSGRIWVKTNLPLSAPVSGAFSLVDTSGKLKPISITGVGIENGGYSLTLSRRVNLSELRQLRVKCGATCEIQTEGLFHSEAFIRDYTYSGNDLGANWSQDSTTFKVWAPTATGVSVLLYDSGNWGSNRISTTEMNMGDRGVWELTIDGDLHGKYYNYLVQFPNYDCEATDPYAKSTGANGDRGMILNMDATDPAGWDKDVSPNQGMSYTDAIIYEMHVREMTIDASSGVKAQWRGKYLGLTQTGTKYNGEATALDHLKELGITHVQLMPVYDFQSVDEYHLTDWEQYAWGYDPKNFNVPEGSYSTDPFKGEVRVKEFKQMVQSFHSSGINVIMDVVYNHTFSGGDFCYNKIVPNYFSRFWGDGSWSNGSGCGNDIATERAMTRNYIVDSVMNWVEEYHVDGFRFDLAGLIDTQTINEIVNTVHAKYPHVMFYGEGWTSGDTAITPGYETAHKGNAWQTQGFGYFNDVFRNSIAGDNGNSTGFATGAGDKADTIGNFFRASNDWGATPTQTINYVSCHDNYSLMDKIIISRNGAYWDQMVRMNNLSAAIYMLSQGTPFIYSGEEVLREKKNQDGHRIENGFGTDDFVNKIRWSDFSNKTYAAMTDDYYSGLVWFRKNHAALRCANGSDAWNFVKYHKINDRCILFYVDGFPNYECSDGIVIIFNAQENTQWVNIYDYGVPYGDWQACIHGDKAGVNALWSTNNGSVGVEGISATVLVKGDLVHEESVYNNQNIYKPSCFHISHNQDGVCDDCGASVSHSFASGKCTVCGKYESAMEYYLFGYINGKDYACEGDAQNMGEYKFVDGKLTATFETNSYIAIKEGGNTGWYMAKSYVEDTTGTFYKTDTGAHEKMFVPGGVELTFTLTKNDDGSLTLSYVKAGGVTLSGSLTSGAAGNTTVELLLDGKAVATDTVSGKTGSYSFEDVLPGSYTLRLSKLNHVTREYAVTVADEDLIQNVKICLLGDVNNDGRVNIGDVARVYSHVKQTTLLTDEYQLACANVNGDTRLNIGDTATLYSHVKETKKLY